MRIKLNQQLGALLLCLILSFGAYGQSIEQPVVVNMSHCNESVAPGSKSAICIKFQVPAGLWLGASPKDARTPPGTKIVASDIKGISFDKPIYPEASKEGVPANLGTTLVYKEEVNIIIPFKVDDDLAEGINDVTIRVTYTPGYNAGRLATHTNEEYIVPVKIDNMANEESIPEPSNNTLQNELTLQPKSFTEYPKLFRFMFNPLKESGGFTKALHSIWLDKSGHGKTVRFMPFPFVTSTNITGSSLGMGGSFFNSTKEGTMTGMFAMTGYSNNLIGGAFGIQAISCPAAYHNYQFSAYFGGEGYRDISLHYENFTLSNSSVGIDVNIESENEPRFRFFGLGPNSVEEGETAYERTNLSGVFDFYIFPEQSLRVGLGLSYADYNTGISFADLTVEEGIPFLQDTDLFNNLIGIDGSSALGIRFNLIYDHRDQEFAPSKGFYGKMTVSRNSLSDVVGNDLSTSYYGLNTDIRQYFSGPSQKLVVLMRGALELKSASDLPFYQLSSIGGANSIRAYDRDRYLGQHSFFASAEMRYTLFTVPVLGYPMSFEMGAFVDAGQVFGDGEALGDEINLDPGITMRMINKPNVGVVLNYAYGSDGGYFTGGIGLPF